MEGNMPATRILLATALGGVTFFLWGTISHTVIPFSENALLGFANEEMVEQAITANAPRSGLYFMPYMPQKQEGMTEEQFEIERQKADKKMQQGTFILASVRLGGMGSMGTYLLLQLVTDLLAAFFVALVLARTAGTVMSRAVTSVVIGLAGYAAISLPQWNWYAFSTAFTLAELFGNVFGFLFAGLVIGKILETQNQQPSGSAESTA
jgi:hypothetical protein